MAEVDLDALVDLLDDEEDEEAVDDPDPVGEYQEDKSDAGDEDVSAIEAQLRQMQEQMRQMQEKLAQKKKTSSSSQKSLQDVDMFTAAGTSNAAARPKSPPPKTNPFESYDRPVRLAKYNADDNKFGPKLPAQSHRVLSGEEREKFEAALRDREKQRNLKMIGRDLELSSDEDEAGSGVAKLGGGGGDDEDPFSSRLNSYGRDITKMMSGKSKQSSLSSPTPPSVVSEKSKSMSLDLGKRPVGFNSVQGSSLNLSNSSSNQLLPKEMLVEKNSRIRISRPEVTQNALDLSLVGRRFIPMHRLKSAISLKQTEGDWATIGIIYFKSSQTSKNGNNYTLCKLTDVQGAEIETCSLLLFGRASAKLYSIQLNRVVGILNPKVLEAKNGKNEISLSVDHPDKILELGDSLDISRCQAKKPDGTGCTNLVNKSSCEFCVYHVKKAYTSMSAKRSDLQSAFSGNGGGNADVRARIMARVAPKGEVFAGGQILNNPPAAMIGRQSTKQTEKDRNRLAGLGVVTLPKVSGAAVMSTKTKVDLLLSDTPGSRLLNDSAFVQPGSGKLTFRSHLSDVERTAVRKVAGASEELGLKLLAPTIGARTLMKHLVKQEDPNAFKEEEEMALLSKKEKESRISIQKQQEARKMLLEHKQKVQAVAKASGSPSTVQKSPALPRLGRGLDSGGFVDLSFSPSTSGSTLKPLDPKKLKALAALKGKAIKKTDPNYVMKRKRSEEDLQNVAKKVASRLEDSERQAETVTSGAENAENIPTGCDPVIESDQRFIEARKRKLGLGEKPKELRSLTGEIIDAKRMDELRKIKSKNLNLAEEAEIEAEDKYFDKLEKREAMEEKMLATKEIETTVYTCKICEYTAMSQSDLCRNSLHPVKKIKVMKKFFECGNCKKRTISFDRYPNRTCSNCGGSKWVRTAMMKEKRGPLLDSEKLCVRGVEQKFINGSAQSASLGLEM